MHLMFGLSQDYTFYYKIEKITSLGLAKSRKIYVILACTAKQINAGMLVIFLVI